MTNGGIVLGPEERALIVASRMVFDLAVHSWAQKGFRGGVASPPGACLT
jgi:hypothetical protein